MSASHFPAAVIKRLARHDEHWCELQCLLFAASGHTTDVALQTGESSIVAPRRIRMAVYSWHEWGAEMRKSEARAGKVLPKGFLSDQAIKAVQAELRAVKFIVP